tara:strand:+ start:276 stop:557 length:282 start_codon:yes stop_codon:yes gene_type:complete
MASLTGQNITDTYKDILTVSGTTRNEGLETTVKQVFDGDGIGSPLWMGTNSLQITGAMSITGTFNLSNKTQAPSSPAVGDIAVINGELYFSKE